MPSTLTRYFLTEFLRVGWLTLVILLVVIAFGAAIKPLSNDAILSPLQMLRYVALAMIPMLQFALPFAAGFAGTMSIHRLATDNEIIAAAASGISYRRLFAPFVVTGALLAAAMIPLTHFIIPKFAVLLERTITRDVPSLLQASVGRGEPFRMGDLQIWADDLVVEPDPDDAEVDTRLILLRVAVADLDADGRIAADVTAQKVILDIVDLADETRLRLNMSEAVAFKPQSGMLAWIERPEATTLRLPRLLGGNPKRMTTWELSLLGENPERVQFVERDRRLLADQIYAAELGRALDRHLREHGTVSFQTDSIGARLWQVRADALLGSRFTRADGRRVEVAEIDRGALLRTYEARVVSMRASDRAGVKTLASGLVVGDLPAEREREPRLALELEDCRWRSAGDFTEAVERQFLRVASLRLDLPVDGALLDEPARALLDRAAAMNPAPAPVSREAAKLTRRLEVLSDEVVARSLSRSALAATPILLLPLGVVTAVVFRRRSPLSIYPIAFVPAVFTLIVIFSGEHLMRDGALAGGALLMYSGHGVLLALLGWSWSRLRRH